MTPEFSRPVQLDRIGRDGRKEAVQANEHERAVLALRFGLPAIDELTCSFDLRPEGHDRVAAQGLLTARIRQTCVATLEEFPATLVESFAVRFVPEGELSASLDIEAPDEVPFAGGTIDLGEATAEQLGLALDPFPRKEDAEDPGEEDQPKPGPFAKLAALRKPS